MFKIGEFSKLVRVSARMLRYYDKCGLLHPAETDYFTGYRLYSAAQIPLLNRIITLRDMGFGVEEIEEILPHFEEPAYMHQVLERKKQEIHTAIESEQSKLERIAAMSGVLKKERANMVYEVELKKLEAVKVLSLRGHLAAYDLEGELWGKLGEYMARNQVACEAGGYSIYHDEEYKEGDVDVEVAVPVKEMKESEGPVQYRVLEEIPLAATVRFSGPYEGYAEAMGKLAGWVEQNGYAICGITRGLALAAPGSVNSPEDYLTEIQVPVQKI